MWICLIDAFVSIVEDAPRPGNLLVRARQRKHLVAFTSPLYRQGKITSDKQRDYRFRVSLEREDVQELLRHHGNNLDYGNFKASVRERELHDMYALWWTDHRTLQPA